jgi:hypothetical protein
VRVLANGAMRARSGLFEIPPGVLSDLDPHCLVIERLSGRRGSTCELPSKLFRLLLALKSNAALATIFLLKRALPALFPLSLARARVL